MSHVAYSSNGAPCMTWQYLHDSGILHTDLSLFPDATWDDLGNNCRYTMVSTNLIFMGNVDAYKDLKICIYIRNIRLLMRFEKLRHRNLESNIYFIKNLFQNNSKIHFRSLCSHVSLYNT